MSDDAVGVSRSLIITVGAQGIRVPRLDDHPALPLDIGALSALSELAAGRSPHEGQAEELLGSLRGRALLTARPVPRASALVDQAPAAGSGTSSRDRSIPADTRVALYTPLQVGLASDGAFVVLDHDGRVQLRLSAVELDAAAAFADPGTVEDGFARHTESAGARAMNRSSFDALVGRLLDANTARRLTPDDSALLAGERQRRIAAVGHSSWMTLRSVVERRTREHLQASRGQPGRRTRVVPIMVNHTIAPLSLGMLFAHAKSYEGGRLEEHYDFVPCWVPIPELLGELLEEPAVVLVSNYVWSHAATVQIADQIRAMSPNSVIIHGGPNTPKYEADCEAYFRAHDSVDVTVRGEGEAATAEILDALAGQFDGSPVDLSLLADVPGISFRHGGEVVRTPDRERIADLDTVPSPYLEGLFDAYAEASREGAHFQALIETNRGCPYGCTFCDWGSATLSRVRKFSMERVLAELEWCARNGASVLAIADANFGMLPRDVEIAERIAELKAIYDCPTTLSLAFAKNSTAKRTEIIETFTRAGIMSEGVMSLQSLDESTLVAIERKNIKVEKYDDLAVQFRRAGLPLWVELMLGLPGSTLESFTNDLQDCIAREVQARINITDLLVNSPMNEPEYKQRFRIETGGGGPNATTQVVATSTFTRDDYQRMLAARRDYLLFENVGVLRQVSRYVRHETGTREIDFYIGLREHALADPESWPVTAFTERAMVYLMAPPVSWQGFLDEIRRYVVEVLGVPDDDALATVFTVQHLLLPARGRSFPETRTLPHDFVAWHNDMLEAKESGHRHDWTASVAPLRTYAPGSFTVDDPHDVCNLGLGTPLLPNMDDTWDLESPVSRQHHLKPVPLVN